MNPYDRMQTFFAGGPLDRLPVLEWAPWWHLTVQRWQGEGLDEFIREAMPYAEAHGLGYGEAIQRAAGLDMMRQFGFNNFRAGAPQYVDGTFLKEETDYEKIKPFLYPYDSIPHVRAAFEHLYEACGGEAVIWGTFEGWFWFPRRLFGIEAHLYSFYDYPELYLQISRDMTDYYSALADEVFAKYQPSFVTLAEDMSYNLGSMLSKDCFDEFLKPFYQKFAPHLHDKGIKLIIDSDGDVTELIPWLIEGGVDGILPLERQAGVDINALSEQYPAFFFLGGFDKMCMKHGVEAIEQEFTRLEPAIARGRYIPSCDHQTPPDVSLACYQQYTALLRKYCAK